MMIAYKDNKTGGNVPHYNELGTIGVSTNSSALRYDANIKSSSHHVNIASDDFRLLRDLIPEQAYKNSGKEIQKILIAVSGKTQKEIRSFFNSKCESELEIWVGPSGGSLVKAGSNPLGANDKSDTDAIAKTPTCVNLNGTERRFIDAVRYRAVVVVHTPARWKDDILTKCRSNDVVNLGLFYFHRCLIQTHEHLRATDSGDSFAEYYGDEGTWTFEPNPIYVLRPVFSKDNPMPVRYSYLTQMMEKCDQPIIFGKETDLVSMDIERSTLKTPKFNTVTCRRVLCQIVNDRLSDKTQQYRNMEVGRTSRLNKCSKQQIINEICRLTVSSWCRLLKTNVYSVNKIGYVKNKRIGWVHGMYAIPNPFRSYNVTVSLLISSIGIKVSNRYPIRKRNTIKTKHILVDVLMTIIVVTTTGNLGVFNNYAKYLAKIQQTNSDDFVSPADIPDTKEKLDIFIQMMLSESGAKGRMCDCIAVLYRQSLMKKCTGTVDEYVTFLRDCRDKLVQLFDDIQFQKWISSEHSYNYYKPIIGKILDSVGSDGSNKNGKPYFISHLVLSNLDELFIDESKEIKEVELGYNGALGPNLVEHDNESKNPKDRWNAFANLVLDILNTAEKDVLDVWGLERDRGLVVVKINQRPVGLSDAEAISCKLVATDERTNGSRLISLTPKIHHPYEWPKQIDLSISPILVVIGRKAIDTFTTTDKFSKMDINPRFMFRDEMNKWNRYCSYPGGDEMLDSEPELEIGDHNRPGSHTLKKRMKCGAKNKNNQKNEIVSIRKELPITTTHLSRHTRQYLKNGFGDKCCCKCKLIYSKFRADHAGTFAFVVVDHEETTTVYCPSCHLENCCNKNDRRAKRSRICS